MSCERATWTPLCLQGPTLLLHLGPCGSRNPRTHVPCCWKPRMPNPWCPDSSHLSFQELTVPIKSGDRTSRVRRAWDYCTRQPRFADVRYRRVFCAPAAKTPRSSFYDQQRTRVRDSPRSAPVADSLPRENPPFITFVLCNLNKGYPS
jgi:hypothetical protein